MQEQLTPVVVVGDVDVEGVVDGAATDVARTAPAAQSPAPDTVNRRAQRLATVYTDVVPLSRFPAVLGIAKKAIDAGKSDDEIERAFIRIAAEGRSLTVETLRIEIEGQPARAAPRRGTDDKVRDGLALAQRLAQEQHPDSPRQIGARS